MELEHDGRKVSDPQAVADLLRSALMMEDEIDRDREHFWVLGVDTRNTVRLFDLVAVGGLTTASVHAREVFRRLLTTNAVSNLIVGHNHPSGDPSPSLEDRQHARKLAQAAKILGLTLLDSVVIGNGTDEYRSLLADGLL